MNDIFSTEPSWHGVVDGGFVFGVDPAGDDVIVSKFQDGYISTLKLGMELEEVDWSTIKQGPLWAPPEPVEQAMSFRIDYEEPALPPLLGKGPGLTGKAYRAYRRKHRRMRQQWNKNGRPMRQMSFYMPRVEVLFDEMTQTMTAVGQSAEQASRDISMFAKAWATHPSNWKSNG